MENHRVVVVEANRYSVGYREQGSSSILVLLSTEPSLDNIAVDISWRYTANRNFDDVLAIEVSCKISVLHVPCLGWQVDVTSTSIVGNSGAVPLVHFPVSNKAWQIRSHYFIFLSKQGAHGAVLVPQYQLVHHASEVSAKRKTSVGVIVGNDCFVKEHCLAAIISHEHS